MCSELFSLQGIELPKDAEILSDYRAIVWDRGVAKVAERNTGGKDKPRHGDSAIAGALAWYASKLEPPQYEYRSAGARFEDPLINWGRHRETDEDRQGAPNRLKQRWWGY